ncbi:MAG: 3-deoxy-7-phosphoheptulonate synthase [Polyangiaceae bacterium]|nr:3-deoxy-7-phosphoheptulonate synthase [Polyangiaceae bacterium]
MIVTLSQGAEVDSVRRELAGLGLWVSSVERSQKGDVHIVVGRGSTAVDPSLIEKVRGVSSVSAPSSAHPLVDAHTASVDVGGYKIGPETPALIAGPCSVESEDQILRIARAIAPHGVRFLRGGAFKPRTSPYAFQGHGRQALSWLRRAADATGMKVVTEVLSEQDVGAVAEHADLLQIGSRNMHNYALLKAVGRTTKPVLLKRSMAATVEEWLLAGEYLLNHGSRSVLFCERGIRTFDDTTRNLLDLGAVALLAHVHGLPVVVDPSHATGRRDLVRPLARAAFAAGAAAVMVEVHDDPAHAESDGPQALSPSDLASIAKSAFSSEAA